MTKIEAQHYPVLILGAGGGGLALLDMFLEEDMVTADNLSQQ